MYIEASKPRVLNDNAKISHMVTLSGQSCLKFSYHMYGSDIGTLRVTLSGGVIFEKGGDQGNVWKTFQTRLKGTGSRKVGKSS